MLLLLRILSIVYTAAAAVHTAAAAVHTAAVHTTAAAAAVHIAADVHIYCWPCWRADLLAVGERDGELLAGEHTLRDRDGHLRQGK